MVDNIKDNDEYEFTDLDTISPDSMDEEYKSKPSISPPERSPGARKNVRRNAFIVVILIILGLLIYKFTGSFFPHKSQSVDTSAISVMPDQTITPIQPEVVQPSQPAPINNTPAADNSEIDQKLSAMDLNQQNLRADITTVNNQLNGISANMNNLSAKVSTMNETLSVLATKLEEQSHQITALMAMKVKKVRPPAVYRRAPIPRITYYIQAVIPGRAWLIAMNGSTLTVREGTRVPDYGIIKLIDANQGRVLTSSGRVIKFSQQDS